MKQIIIILFSPTLVFSQTIQSAKTNVNLANQTNLITNKVVVDSVAINLLKNMDGESSYGLSDEVKFVQEPKSNLIPNIPKINKKEKQNYEIVYMNKGKVISNPFINKTKIIELFIETKPIVDLNIDNFRSEPTLIKKVQRVNPIIKSAKIKKQKFKININLLKFKFRFIFKRKKSKFSCYKF